jgi:hypothetical protein
MRTKFVLPLVLLGLVGTTLADPPFALFVDQGACPGEGCTYGTWRATKTAPVRTQPNYDAPVIGKVKPGTNVNALTGEVHVVPHQFVVSKPDPHGRYKKGDVLWVYTYVGEGNFKVWFDGTMFDENLGFGPGGGSSGTRCQESAECWGELKGEYQGIWWAKIQLGKGLTGWSEAENFTFEPMY